MVGRDGRGERQVRGEAGKSGFKAEQELSPEP